MNGTAVSRRHSNSSKDDEGPNMKTKEGSQTSMATENHRKEESIAETEASGRNPVQPTKSVMVAEAEWKESFLPDSPQCVHIPKIENVVSDYNIQIAIKAVKRNKGAPGIDGITVSDIKKLMMELWPKVKQDILEGKYRPTPVRGVKIPKPDGSGVRQLGIPTVMDRIIQQALYQELVGAFEPIFSENSYGFRPNRNAHQAVLKAQSYIQEGCDWVVDIDLEKFFDRVNHDILMSRVARRVKDKKILLLLRRYLQAGIMENGLYKVSEEGTPQGGPISPLLSNIMLDDFDKELEARGLRFARYADDCNIYVKSEKAGQRVMESLIKFLTTKLKLKVNQQKSAVARPWERKFLGFTFIKGSKPGLIKVHESRIKRFKDKIRGLTKKMRGNNPTESIKRFIMPITRGWANYFGLADIKTIFNDLDGWIRRKIRGIIWRQWKKLRTRLTKLIAAGFSRNTARKWAYSSKGPWRMAKTYCMHKALSNSIIEEMGYIPMAKMVQIRSECS